MLIGTKSQDFDYGFVAQKLEHQKKKNKTAYFRASGISDMSKVALYEAVLLIEVTLRIGLNSG